MLLTSLIEKLNEILKYQGDGTVVIDVEERDNFTGDFDVTDRYFMGNYPALYIEEGKKPYCFIFIPIEDN